jgi:amino acid transporter
MHFLRFASYPFKMLGVLMFGMLVAHDDPALLQSRLFALLKFPSLSILSKCIGSGTAAQSPFVIAMSHTGVKGAILSPFT